MDIEIRKADWFEMQSLNNLVIMASMYYSKSGKVIDTCNTCLLDEDVREEITENAYVIVHDKMIIGLATVWGKYKTIISNLYIVEEYRKKGYGKALLDYIIKEKGECVIVLAEYYNASIGFYKHLGYQITDKETNNKHKLLWLSQKKGVSMKEYLLNIHDNDYAIIDRNNVVDYKTLKEILLTIKKVFDFLENNKGSYSGLYNEKYNLDIKLDCIREILNDKYHSDIELVNKEVKRIDTGIFI